MGSKIQIMEVDMGQTSKMEIQEESILVAVCASVSGVYLTLKCAHIEIRVQVKKKPMDPPNGRCHHETVHFEGSINVTRAYHTG